MLFFALFIVALCAAYWYFTRNHDYWLKRNVKFLKPLPLVGNHLDIFTLKKSRTQVINELYWAYPEEKIVGYYNGNKPEMIIRDPNIIKKILITDFSCFYARGLITEDTDVQPLMKNLFFVDGDIWKLLRQRMTPAFTSGKLKAMFPIIIEMTEHLQERVASIVEKTPDCSELDARDLMARFTTDFIGAVGFGLNSDSLKNDDSPFRKIGKKMFSISFIDALQRISKQLFPVLLKNLKVGAELERDLTSLVRQILVQRNYEPSNRHDFVDLLLECQKKGIIAGDSIEKVNPDGTPMQATLEMTELLICAQIFIFFVAGFETSSSVTSYTLHQLAFNPEKQQKVQEDIDKVLLKYDNKLCYDAIKEMSYLEWTFKEAMRMFPSVGFLVRQNKRKYTIPEVNVSIDEGVTAVIPVQALQNDPKYFANPEEFRPERFSPEEWDLKNNYVFLPFGEGPRACIGERLGRMQSLAGLAALLAKFNVSPSPRSQRQPQVNPRSQLVQTVKDGLPLQFTLRKRVAK